MNPAKIFLATGLLNLTIWSLKVANYFFDYHVADEISLLISFLIPYFLGRTFKGSSQVPFWLTAFSLVLITLAIYPLLSFFLQRTDYAWVLPNVMFVGMGVMLGYTRFEHEKSYPIFLVGGMVWFLPIQFIPDQNLYFDRLVESTATRQGKVHRVLWKGEQWIHYNGRLTAATIDAHLYYEPLVHPALSLARKAPQVLLVGGDNGLAIKEILKYEPDRIDVIPYDVDFFKRSDTYDGPVISEDPFVWLNETSSLYDVIIVDLPDPIDAITNQYYTLEFYELCMRHLHREGLLVTQASSPYFHTKTHYSIKATIEAAGLSAINYHNQVPTIGQWGWVIASQENDDLKTRLQKTNTMVTTRWWNQEAMQMMLSFGKSGYFDQRPPTINTIKSPLFLTKP